jgi:hypothetical protein
MRISADPKDPDYDWRSHTASVTLNGKPLSGCVTADEEAGTAEVLLLDPNGRVGHDETGAAVHEVLFGEVRIIMPEIEE